MPSTSGSPLKRGRMDSNTSTTREGEQEVSEDDTINCTCGKKSDRGLMIQCEKCNYWLHVRCLGIRSTKLPEKYYCPRCVSPSNATPPRSLSTHRASNEGEGTGPSDGLKDRVPREAVAMRVKVTEGPASQPLPTTIEDPKVPEVAMLKSSLNDFPIPSPRISREERKLQQVLKTFAKLEKKDERPTKKVGDTASVNDFQRTQVTPTRTPLKRARTPRSTNSPVTWSSRRKVKIRSILSSGQTLSDELAKESSLIVPDFESFFDQASKMGSSTPGTHDPFLTPVPSPSSPSPSSSPTIDVSERKSRGSYSFKKKVLLHEFKAKQDISETLGNGVHHQERIAPNSPKSSPVIGTCTTLQQVPISSSPTVSAPVRAFPLKKKLLMEYYANKKRKVETEDAATKVSIAVKDEEKKLPVERDSTPSEISFNDYKMEDVEASTFEAGGVSVEVKVDAGSVAATKDKSGNVILINSVAAATPGVANLERTSCELSSSVSTPGDLCPSGISTTSKNLAANTRPENEISSQTTCEKVGEEKNSSCTPVSTRSILAKDIQTVEEKTVEEKTNEEKIAEKKTTEEKTAEGQKDDTMYDPSDINDEDEEYEKESNALPSVEVVASPPSPSEESNRKGTASEDVRNSKVLEAKQDSGAMENHEPSSRPSPAYSRHRSSCGRDDKERSRETYNNFTSHERGTGEVYGDSRSSSYSPRYSRNGSASAHSVGQGQGSDQWRGKADPTLEDDRSLERSSKDSKWYSGRSHDYPDSAEYSGRRLSESDRGWNEDGRSWERSYSRDRHDRREREYPPRTTDTERRRDWGRNGDYDRHQDSKWYSEDAPRSASRSSYYDGEEVRGRRLSADRHGDYSKYDSHDTSGKWSSHGDSASNYKNDLPSNGSYSSVQNDRMDDSGEDMEEDMDIDHDQEEVIHYTKYSGYNSHNGDSTLLSPKRPPPTVGAGQHSPHHTVSHVMRSPIQSQYSNSYRGPQVNGVRSQFSHHRRDIGSNSPPYKKYR